jgi:hypothetical protein
VSCDLFDRFTEKGVDDPAGWAELDAHAAECPTCREKRALWLAIGEAAPSLHKTWPTPDLYGRIKRAAASGAVPGGAAPRPVPLWARAAAAAALVALVVLSAIGVRVFRAGAGREPLSFVAGGRSPLLTEQALTEVETSESAYLASIEKLSRLARPRLEADTSPLGAAYREKLLLLDSEIAEMRGEIERNRFNTHLRRELLAMYREKQRTLQDLMKGSSS